MPSRLTQARWSQAEVDALAALGLQLVAEKRASATDKKIAYMDRITMSKHKKAKADPTYQTVEARIAALTGIRQHKDEAAYFVAQVGQRPANLLCANVRANQS